MPYKNLEDRRAYGRRAAKRYAAKHPERIKACVAKWRAENRDYANGRAKERRKKLKESGLCTWCAVNKSDGGIYCAECRKKSSECCVNFHLANPDWRRGKHKIERYGITLKEFDEMRAAQEFKCAICKRHESEFKRGIVPDHDHLTGKLRGLLCSGCNLRIVVVDGRQSLRFKNPELEKKAQEYIKHHENSGQHRPVPGARRNHSG